jgi:endonuclease/exonuclease/phosphatase family metal-dependent hydrolase
VVLSEVPDGGEEDLAELMGPEGRPFAGDGLVVVARRGLKEEGRASNGRAEAVLAACCVGNGSVRVMAVDLPSDPWVERKPLVLWVFALMREWQPDIVVGDFNTPRHVSVLRDAPAGYAHAYDRCGSGPSYTWPVPVPLWALDQCMTGPHVEPAAYELRSTLRSDHRMQVLDFACAPPP